MSEPDYLLSQCLQSSSCMATATPQVRCPLNEHKVTQNSPGSLGLLSNPLSLCLTHSRTLHKNYLKAFACLSPLIPCPLRSPPLLFYIHNTFQMETSLTPYPCTRQLPSSPLLFCPQLCCNRRAPFQSQSFCMVLDLISPTSQNPHTISFASSLLCLQCLLH